MTCGMNWHIDVWFLAKIMQVCVKRCFHTEGLGLDLSMFDPKLLCSRTVPRPAWKGALVHSAQEVWKQQCPNKEAGCYIPISSSVLRGRCWSRKMGKMIVVGDSKKKHLDWVQRHSKLQWTKVAELMKWFLLLMCTSSLQTNSLHTTTYPSRLCTYASVLGHRMGLLMWKVTCRRGCHRDCAKQSHA